MSVILPYLYCHQCGHRLPEKKTVKLDFAYCRNCKRYFYYHTPQTVAVIVQNSSSEILLVKRKLAPARGLWCLPSGFVEFGEHPYAAAIRELKEETSLTGYQPKFWGMYLANDYPETFSLLIAIKVNCTRGRIRSGDDTLAARYMKFDSLPSIAFPIQKTILEEYKKSLQEINV